MDLTQRFVVGLTILFSTCLTSAQEVKYPSKAVSVLVPFTAGTNADIIARLYAEKLSERLRYPFVVENRAGAGGVVASQVLLNAPVDGHALLFVSSAHAVNPSLHKSLPYDTSRDFSGIALVGYSPTVLVTSPSLGARTQEEFIALVRQRPGQLNYGSAGLGSATHFSCEYFRAEARIEMTHVPYKGVQEFISEILSGRLHLGCPPVALGMPHVRAAKLIALSVTSKERTSLLPDVPTTSEAGLRGFEFGIWYGLVASSKTPKAILERLAAEMLAITRLNDISEKMANQGVAPRDLTGNAFDAFIKDEIEKTRSLAKASGLQAN